jgi:aspartokinase
VAVEGLEDVALVAAVGSGIRDTVGVGGRILGALAAAGINVLLAQAGASPVAVYTLVRRKDKDGALRAIHGVL